ncbi:MAG: hypothetical protein ACRDS0_23460 [Pseudonocardiaceae bacterium]
MLGPRSALRPGWGPSATGGESILATALANPVLANPVAHESDATSEKPAIRTGFTYGEATYDVLESIK